MTYECNLSMPASAKAGQHVTATVYVKPNAYTNRNVPITITVEGRPDATVTGNTNNQGYFSGSFTANAGDPGGVTAHMSRQGADAGSCSAHYSVSG